MNYTKGEWEANKSPLGDWVISASGKEVDILVCRQSRHYDAHLIVTAVNACASVNLDNPIAVAESIKEMYEALKAITELAPRDRLRLPYAIEAVAIADKALAKVESKYDTL